MRNDQLGRIWERISSSFLFRNKGNMSSQNFGGSLDCTDVWVENGRKCRPFLPDFFELIRLYQSWGESREKVAKRQMGTISFLPELAQSTQHRTKWIAFSLASTQHWQNQMRSKNAGQYLLNSQPRWEMLLIFFRFWVPEM